MPRFTLILCALIALALSLSPMAATAQEATVTPSPSPIPPPVLPYNARFEGLPVGIAPNGYPQIGYPNAPVSVTVYAAFDEPAVTPISAQVADAVTTTPTPASIAEPGAVTPLSRPSADFFAAGGGFEVLLQRARNAEILITYLPVVVGAVPNGRGTARAALCAGEQGAFWRYAELLMAWGRDAELSDEARFAGTRLIEGVDTLDLDAGRWNECMISERPDRVIAEADAQRAAQQLYTTTPFVLVGSLSTLLDPESLDFTVTYAVSEASAAFERALAEGDAEAEAQAAAANDPLATVELTPEIVTLEPLMGDQVPPPFTITLPAGWLSGFDTLVLQDVDAIRNIPFALYQGPVTGGTGTLVVMWGFPNLITGGMDAFMAGEPLTPDLYADGSRLLRLAVVEEGCNVGTDLRRSYPIGGLEAVGTQFAAVGCPELADTRGWFAGLQQFSLNFVFYAYAEPIEAVPAAEPELQAILDTITFVLPIATPTPAP